MAESLIKKFKDNFKAVPKSSYEDLNNRNKIIFDYAERKGLIAAYLKNKKSTGSLSQLKLFKNSTKEPVSIPSMKEMKSRGGQSEATVREFSNKLGMSLPVKRPPISKGKD